MAAASWRWPVPVPAAGGRRPAAGETIFPAGYQSVTERATLVGG
jgi:hypothetical protein